MMMYAKKEESDMSGPGRRLHVACTVKRGGGGGGRELGGGIRHFSSIWLMGVSARGLGEVRKHTKRRRLFYTRRKMWPSYGAEFALLLGKCNSSAGKILVAKKKTKPCKCIQPVCLCAHTHTGDFSSVSQIQ